MPTIMFKGKGGGAIGWDDAMSKQEGGSDAWSQREVGRRPRTHLRPAAWAFFYRAPGSPSSGSAKVGKRPSRGQGRVMT
jgi:hypothetical protein